VFGEKDFQQLAVIRTLVRDLNMPIQIIGEPTVRAEDGLALSSRNGYLSAEQRAAAPALYRTLQQLASAIRDGNRDFAQLIEAGQASLVSAGFRPDYLEIREASSLRPAEANDTQLVILGAAFMGTTRLIDNLAFQL
jgi:pantoate--beta-alanine ligase